MLKLIVLTVLLALLFSNELSAAESPSQAKAMFDNAATPEEYKQALAALTEAHRDSDEDAELTFYLGRSLFHDQQLEAADELLTANIKKHPEHDMSHYVLGSVKLTRVAEVSLFRKIGMAKAALSSWQRAYELNPDNVEALYGIVEFYYTAPGVAGGDKTLGAEQLEVLASVSEPWADLSKASRAAQAESFQEAEALFQKAIQGIPHRAFPQLMLANTYVRQEEYEAALKALERYRQRDKTWNDPGTPQIELMAARIYSGLGQQAEARDAIELVLASNPPEAIREQAEQTLEGLETMVTR